MTNPFIIEEIVDSACLSANKHYPFSRGTELQGSLARVFSRYLGQHRSGARFEAEGILVTGPTGAGKSTEINHVITRFNQSHALLSDGNSARIVSCMLDANDGWKGLGRKTLAALGYKLADSSRNTQSQIWQKVISQAKGQGVVGIHFDEAQHILRRASDAERLAILDSFKTLLKSSDWPLILILSGVTELAGQVREEPQLFRLLNRVEFTDITLPRDFDTLHDVVGNFALDAGLETKAELASEDFYDRLATAAGFRWGLVISIVKQAIEEAKLMRSGELTIDLFLRAWTNKTGMIPAASPFLNRQYRTAFPRDRLFWSDKE